MIGNCRLLTDILNGTFDYSHQNITRPVSRVTTYHVSEVKSAFRLMQTGSHRGEIAIAWTEGTGLVPKLRRSKLHWRFRILLLPTC